VDINLNQQQDGKKAYNQSMPSLSVGPSTS
jgi:hypothetical protein